ncbi:MAG TPA: ABC transporter substrate-binding protein, partial [Acidimicrobiales bacterium]
MRFRRLVPVALAAAVVLGACGSDNSSGTATTGGAASGGSSGEKVTLRLGYFPNITHATALVGVEKGIFADKLGPNVTLQTQTFNAGPNAIDALFAESIDATYVGPNPAINGYAKSKG